MTQNELEMFPSEENSSQLDWGGHGGARVLIERIQVEDL